MALADEMRAVLLRFEPVGNGLHAEIDAAGRGARRWLLLVHLCGPDNVNRDPYSFVVERVAASTWMGSRPDKNDERVGEQNWYL